MALRGIIPEPTNRSLVVLHVPEEDTAVAADGGEGLIVGGAGDVEDWVAVRGVALDGLGRSGGGGLCAGEVDLPVGAAGEDVGAAEGGEGNGVDGAGVRGERVEPGGRESRFAHRAAGLCDDSLGSR